MIIYIQEIREFYKYMAQEYYKCNFDSCRIYITFVMQYFTRCKRDLSSFWKKKI